MQETALVPAKISKNQQKMGKKGEKTANIREPAAFCIPGRNEQTKAIQGSLREEMCTVRSNPARDNSVTIWPIGGKNDGNEKAFSDRGIHGSVQRDLQFGTQYKAELARRVAGGISKSVGGPARVCTSSRDDLELEKGTLHENKNDTSVDSRGSSTSGAVPEFAERHYSVAEVACFWNLSEDFVRRIFDKEPGVLVFEDVGPRRSKRRYRTLRVPQHVLDRVHRRISQV